MWMIHGRKWVIGPGPTSIFSSGGFNHELYLQRISTALQSVASSYHKACSVEYEVKLQSDRLNRRFETFWSCWYISRTEYLSDLVREVSLHIYRLPYIRLLHMVVSITERKDFAREKKEDRTQRVDRSESYGWTCARNACIDCVLYRRLTYLFFTMPWELLLCCHCSHHFNW